MRCGKSRACRAMSPTGHTNATAAANKKPGGAGLQANSVSFGNYFASLAIWLVRRDTFRLAAFL
jgi:hypothetical protein